MEDFKNGIEKGEPQLLEPVELSEADLLAVAGGRMPGQTQEVTVDGRTKCCWTT